MATMVSTTNTITPMLLELRAEAAITKRVLDRVPADKLTWKPHPKSMTLGQLAGHIAAIPGRIASMAQQDSFDVLKGSFVPQQPNSLEEILTTLEQEVRNAEQILQGMTEEHLAGKFRLMKGDRELFSQPRSGILRTIMLNHWYHHRGQLSVYLRLLEVPLPVIYGRSADTDPFA
ncbi:MAG: DinB family protein [Acidobacteriia bacterium]|nr:DinB family protein [Terriglobia bacterium]